MSILEGCAAEDSGNTLFQVCYTLKVESHSIFTAKQALDII